MRKFICIFITCILSITTNAQQLKLLVPLDSIHYVADKLQPYLNAETDLFISGESHGVCEANDEKIYHLFLYLNKNYGVRTIVWEAGLAFNYYVEQYLQSGDTLLLSELSVDNLAHSKRLFTNLYQYNLILPSNQKIKSIGLDLESWDDYNYSINCLKYILQKHSTNEISLPSAIYLNTLKGSSKPSFIKQLDTLNQLIKKDSLALVETLGKHFLPFYELSYRLRISTSIMNKNLFGQERESLLTEHFQKFVIPIKEKVYSQFGDAHLPGNKLYNPFTLRIPKNNPSYKITPISAVYINCYSNYGWLIKYSHSTNKDPLKKFKQLRKKLTEQKGIWLAVIEQKSGLTELVIIASNYK